jgi:hypothetical protein
MENLAIKEHQTSQINELEALMRFLVIATAQDEEVSHPGLHASLKNAHSLALSIKQTHQRALPDPK